MASTKEFVSNHVAEQGGRHISCVSHHDRFTFVDKYSVDDASVVGRTSTAPAACFDLHFDSLVGNLQHPLGPFEQQTAKISDQAEGVDVDLQLIHDPRQLVALSRRVELNFVADDEIQWETCRYEIENVDIGRDFDCRCRYAETARDLRPIPVEFGQQNASSAPHGQIVVDLQCQRALTRTHRAEAEAQSRHAPTKLVGKSHIDRMPSPRTSDSARQDDA